MVKNNLIVFWGFNPEKQTLQLALGYQWDSRHFLSIAEHGYPTTGNNSQFAFAPFYPLLIAVVNLLINNYYLSGLIVSNSCYFLSIWSFYRVARLYTDENESLFLTILFGLFPTYAVYGTLAYSESTYLFLATQSWYYFVQKKYDISSIYTTFCILTRYISGLLIVIYVLIGLSEKLKKCTNETPIKDMVQWKLLWFGIPIGVLGGVFFYFYTITGDFFVTFSSHAYFNDSLLTPIHQFFGFTAKSSYPRNMVEIPIERYIFTIPFLVLSFILYKDDKDLGLYGTIMMIMTLSMVGVSSIASPRVMLASWVSILAFNKRISKLMYFVLSILFFFGSLWVMLKFQTIFFS